MVENKHRLSAQARCTVGGLEEDKRGTGKNDLCSNEDACDLECKRPTDLRGINAALLEGTAGGVVGAQVAVLAPVAAEGTVHT